MKPNSRLFVAALACAVVAAAALAWAQAPAPADPVSGGAKMLFGSVSGYLTRSADKVSEDVYAFKPTPDVRSFGQILGHVADSHYVFCSAALGEKPPVSGIEKSKTSKADLAKAFADSVAYCQKAYDSLTDAKGAEMVAFFGRQMARATILSFNIAHDNEHYGNLVTYMRLKNVVPPSSEPRK